MRKIKRLLKKSHIHFFSDLFIAAMVTLWIVDCVYESIIATAVTVASIVLSFQTEQACFDTSMWSNIGTNVAVPLSTGGAIWMIKNSVQHALANRKGKECKYDFAVTDIDNEEVERKEGNCYEE